MSDARIIGENIKAVNKNHIPQVSIVAAPMQPSWLMGALLPHAAIKVVRIDGTEEVWGYGKHVIQPEDPSRYQGWGVKERVIATGQQAVELFDEFLVKAQESQTYTAEHYNLVGLLSPFYYTVHSPDRLKVCYDFAEETYQYIIKWIPKTKAVQDDFQSITQEICDIARIDEAITEIAYLNRLLDLMDPNYIKARTEEGPEGHLQASQEQLERLAEGEQGLSGSMSIIDIAKYISQLDPSDFAVQADWSDISSEIDRYISDDSHTDPNTSQNTNDENITVEMDDSEGQVANEGFEQADYVMLQAVLAGQQDGDASAAAEQANLMYQEYNSSMVSAGNSAYGMYNAALSGDGLALAQNTVNLVTSIDQAVDSYLKLEGGGDRFLSGDISEALGKIGAGLNFAGDLIELTESIGSGDANEANDIIDYRLAA